MGYYKQLQIAQEEEKEKEDKLYMIFDEIYKEVENRNLMDLRLYISLDAYSDMESAAENLFAEIHPERVKVLSIFNQSPWSYNLREFINCESLEIQYVEFLDLNLLIQEELKYLTKLNSLFINECEGLIIPNSINALKNLVRLHISWSSIKRLPKTIISLPLEEIYLLGNNLKKFPDLLFDCPYLKKITYSYNGKTIYINLSTYPELIG